ncbi:DUF4238 domain-containing protein [Spirosoma sp. HMF3257]|uniref:DUF4238 domain-containing protein n=1 Tax=Spirosoma telluris TaxID=2183553 RepID=A0A327NLC4_9BACT|nr:DUF4238 domain-containing protein [Spirosoma telluris]RAI76002.1 hypothetical protein HMF3257_20800 [Spirosoma telluris]
MEYKKNHTIPRVILKEWVSKKDGLEGVFVYEIDKKKEYFSSAKGGRGFSFAITNFLYVPDIDGKKHPNLEKWKSGLESVLSKFIRSIKSQQVKGLVKDNAELALILMSIISLDATSKYDIELGYKFLIDNPEYKKLISGEPEREIKILLLENAVNSVNEEISNYEAIEFTVLTAGEDSEFIYCDRPLISKPFDETSFIVLTKNTLLAFKNVKGTSTIEYKECRPDMVDNVNQLMVERSREWIIASKQAILDKYKAIIGSDRWIRSVKEDRIVYTPIKNLKHGNYFKSLE